MKGRPRVRRPAEGGRAASAREALLGMKLRGFLTFARSQPASFWGISAYLLFEYVRPQSVYPVIAFAPWPLIILVGTAAALLLEGYRLKLENPADKGLLVFAMVVLVSSVFAFQPSASFDGWELFFSWVLVYVLITRIIDRESRVFVFLMLYLLFHLKMSQHAVRSWASEGFQFRNWGVNGGPGWFHNSGEFGIAMAMFVPLATFLFWGLRKRLDLPRKLAMLVMPASAVIGAVASSSRGAQLAVAAVAGWMVMMSPHRVRMAAAVVPLSALGWLMMPAEQLARMDAIGSDETSMQRLTVWRYGIDMAKDNPILGIGYANWGPYVERFHPPPHLLSHNIFIEAVSELGLIGLFSFIALIVVTFIMNRRSRKMAARLQDGDFLRYAAFGLDGSLIGYVVSGLFVTVLYYPFFWVNLALTVSVYRATKRQLREELGSRPSVGRRVRPPTLAGRA